MVSHDELIKTTAQDDILGIGCHMANAPARVEPALSKLVSFLKDMF